MAAPIGNKFWTLRSKHGRDKLFATPELLWEAACEYFDWCEEHPWVKTETRTKALSVESTQTIKERPMTLSALCLYLDVSHNFWTEFKKRLKETDKDFLVVTARIEQIIYTQKFEGAAVGIFNANIISRDLGLIDKSDLTSKGEKIEPRTIIEWGDKKIHI